MSSLKSTDERPATTAALLRGRLAVRMPPGPWRVGDGAAVAIWRDAVLEGIHYARDIPCERPPIAEDAAAYAVDLNPFPLRFGAAGIGSAVVQRSPRVLARLGMSGAAGLCFVHASGLWALLDGGAVAALDRANVLARLRTPIARALREAVESICGAAPWDRDAVERIMADGSLRDAAAGRLFRLFYERGLLAVPGEIRIDTLAFSPMEDRGIHGLPETQDR